MKRIMAAAALSAAITANAGKVFNLPQLPDGTLPNTEVTTNFPIHVDAQWLETFSLKIEADNCSSNEVLVAVGHDSDGNGDLAFDETSFVFGIDCGTRYLVNYDEGTCDTTVGDTVCITHDDFNPSWNLAKIVKRGEGTVGESVTEAIENKKFTIILR